MSAFTLEKSQQSQQPQQYEGNFDHQYTHPYYANRSIVDYRGLHSDETQRPSEYRQEYRQDYQPDYQRALIRKSYTYEHHPYYAAYAQRRYLGGPGGSGSEYSDPYLFNRRSSYDSSRFDNRLERTDQRYDNNNNNSPHHQQTRIVDPLTSFLPGPLAPLTWKDTEMNHMDIARKFLMTELLRLRGDVHIMYESVRRFGRFDIRDGKMKLDDTETEEDVLEGLSRLWQMGNGYVYIRHMEDARDSYRKRRLNVSIYHAKDSSWIKLDPKDTETMVRKDPLWGRVQREERLSFI